MHADSSLIPFFRLVLCAQFAQQICYWGLVELRIFAWFLTQDSRTISIHCVGFYDYSEYP
jgi:hypothetical protein